MFPFTRVPFWVHILHPQPVFFRFEIHMKCSHGFAVGDCAEAGLAALLGVLAYGTYWALHK